jgi:hypothetical protein
VSSINLVTSAGSTTNLQFPVVNSGDGVLNIAASALAVSPGNNWLSIEPETLSLAPAAESYFTISILSDSAHSGFGDCQGAITFVTNTCPDSVRQLPVLVYVMDVPEHGVQQPYTTNLAEAYPNPFNLETSLEFTVDRTRRASILLYNINGKMVRTLFDADAVAGKHRIKIHGTDLASGMYFVVLHTQDQNFSRKILLIK